MQRRPFAPLIRHTDLLKTNRRRQESVPVSAGASHTAHNRSNRRIQYAKNPLRRRRAFHARMKTLAQQPQRQVKFRR